MQRADDKYKTKRRRERTFIWSAFECTTISQKITVSAKHHRFSQAPYIKGDHEWQV